jgi:hypothetical protein
MLASLFLLLATWLNRKDLGMLILSGVVAIIYVLPFNLIHDRTAWYLLAMFCEGLIAATAFATGIRGKNLFICLSLMLIVVHIVSLLFNSHLPTSPYRDIVKWLEYLELISLSLFSQPILLKLKGIYSDKH